MCESALNASPTGNSSAASPLPSPLYSDAFQHVGWRDAAALNPIENDGWRRVFDKANIPAWNSAKTPSRISFDWSGSGVVAVFADPPSDLRRIQFCIAGDPQQTPEDLTQPTSTLLIL